jgi:hypothetical protein
MLKLVNSVNQDAVTGEKMLLHAAEEGDAEALLAVDLMQYISCNTLTVSLRARPFFP